MYKPAVLASLLFSTVAASELAVYWGQGEDGTNIQLEKACEESAADIIIMSFITNYGNGQSLGYSFWPDCGGGDCSSLKAGIDKCHANNKKVFVSLGGGDGSGKLDSDGDASGVAWEIIAKFGSPSSSENVLGGASVDGVDLDIESGDSSFYDTLIDTLKSSSSLLVSGAPQCPTESNEEDPTAKIVRSANSLDYLFVQFYNNGECEPTGNSFEDYWNKWSSIANDLGAKLFLGTPASSGSADSQAYLDSDKWNSVLDTAKSVSNFGGVSLWDLEDARLNTNENGVPYDEYVKSLL